MATLFFKVCPFRTMKKLHQTINICQSRFTFYQILIRYSRNGQTPFLNFAKAAKICLSGEISPILVTLFEGINLKDYHPRRYQAGLRRREEFRRDNSQDLNSRELLGHNLRWSYIGQLYLHLGHLSLG